MQDSVAADSDADGMADYLELEMGFDYNRRRSRGPILDSICFQLAGSANCSALLPSCSTNQNALGLSECDLRALA